MHSTLTTIQAQLKNLIAQVQSAIPSDEPFGNAQGNWSFPGLTRVELIEEAQSIVDLINDRGLDEIGPSDARLQDYARRIEFLRAQTVGQIWGNAGLGVPAYMTTLAGLRAALQPALREEEGARSLVALRKLAGQVRIIESRLKALEPRTGSLASMVERIENAYNAAEQLPADMETLAEERKKLEGLVSEAQTFHLQIAGFRASAASSSIQLEKNAEEAKSVLERCETAYSAATSVGLAAAFSERSSALSMSMWIWVVGLVSALIAGSVFGSAQLHSLAELFKQPNVAPSAILLNLMLSLLSVGAPVWFAWLATKQIGQRFRLAEDYAFKASISRAYEGFRREAARVDKDMEARLLGSALTRLDELPLRLVEPHSHGSPWHELASSDVVKQALRAVPGFAEQVKDVAIRALNAVSPKGKGAPPSSGASEPSTAPPPAAGT